MSGKESSRVLVIDDDDLVLTIIRKMLDAELFSVDVSVSAREALGRLPETRYDAILCDMWMPGMTGKDFYNQVKKEFPEYQSRIIFLTGDIASETTWEFIEQKRLPYILKPVSAPELKRKLREVMGERLKAAPKKGAEQRRHRRLAMKANLRIRKKRWAAAGPEITLVGNASKEGVYFLTDRQYGVGTDVLVSFPYTGQGDIEQEGCVVRVDERSDGRRGVAIALGKAAVDARGPLTLPQVSGVEPAFEVADLKLQLDRERKEAHRLTDELADLKGSYKRAASERDRLASEESDRDFRARELTSTRDAMGRLAEELKQQVQDLQEKLAASERGRAQQAERAHDAQKEAAKAADLKTELDQERKADRRLTQEMADLKGVHERAAQERDRFASQESDRSLKFRELTSTRDAMSRLAEELKQQVQDLQEKLAASERERAQQAERAHDAQKEAAKAADLKTELDQERKAARRLTQELADLKGVHERAAQERDRLASQESDRSLKFRELTSTRDAMSRLAEELKQQVQDLQEKLAASERGRAQKAERARDTQKEATKAADLKTELDQERKAARRLTQELADLKGVHQRAVQERDRLASQEYDLSFKLRELTSTRDTMNRLVGEFRKKIQGLEKHVAGVEAERDRAQKEVRTARGEAEKWRAESRRQQQTAASSERATRGQASPAKEQKGDAARLREDLKGLRARIQEFQGGGVGPLTNLAANCDLLTMNKSLDAPTRKSAKEMSQQAAQLRKAFQKLTRKS